MARRRIEYPSVARLREGLLLSTIDSALWRAKFGGGSRDPNDDPTTWGIRDGDRAHGEIKDDGARVMGYVFFFRSSRNPFRKRSFAGPVDPYQYLAGMPPEFRDMVDQAEVRRKLESPGDRCIITAAFWSEGERLTAAEPWSLVLRHSANAIRALVEAPDQPEAWLSGDNEADRQIRWSLYRRKQALGDEPLVLRAEDRALILEAARPFWERQLASLRELVYPRLPDPPPLAEYLAAQQTRWLTLDGVRQELTKVGILLP